MIRPFIILALCLCCNLCMGSNKSFKSNEEYLAGVLYAETLGESDYGRHLVATVIWVRAQGNISNFRKVCSIPKQFAKPQRNDDPEWKKCYDLSKKMYAGKFKPVYMMNKKGDAVHPDHFYLVNWPTPFWARGKFHKKVGRLYFLNLGKYRGK